MGVYGTRDGKFTVKKITVQDKIPVSYSIPYLSSVSTTAIMAQVDWSTIGTQTITGTAFTNQPSYPRTLSVNAEVAGTTDGPTGDGLIFRGYNAKGDYVKETVYVSSAAKGLTYTQHAYAKLTSITADDTLHKSSDVNIGVSSGIGLPWPIASSADILTYRHGINYSTGDGYGRVAITASTDVIHAADMQKGSTIHVVYLSKLQE